MAKLQAIPLEPVKIGIIKSDIEEIIGHTTHMMTVVPDYILDRPAEAMRVAPTCHQSSR
jgi:hypothetical protein